jgi:hypothetical protein
LPHDPADRRRQPQQHERHHPHLAATDLGVRGTDGPIRATVEVTVDPLNDARSRLTISVDFTGHGPGKLLVPLLVRPQARKEMPRNLAALKANIETRTD